jgi:chromosome segregation ATPase
MEQSQLSQMVTWLDEEHKRDRNEINELQKQVESLTQEKKGQAQRIAQLDTELAALRTQIDRATQVGENFERFKQEMNTLLDDSSSLRQQALRDAERVRQIEMENITKTLGELRKEVDKLRRHAEELTAHRVEAQRLSGIVTQLQQQLIESDKADDEQARTISYLEDQRHQDNKRIAQLQAQIDNLLKQFEIQSSQIQHLEQLTTRVNELKSNIDGLQHQQNQFLEKVQFHEAQRERLMQNWREDAERFRQHMGEYEQRMERYTEQYQRTKRATEELQEFEAQLQRQQHETAELQRLAENRQRSQWDEFQAQEEQRRKKQLMEWEHQWSQLDRGLAELTEQVTSLQKQATQNRKHLDLMIQLAEEDVQTQLTASRDRQLHLEELFEEE